MTLVDSETGSPVLHMGELRLRRFRAGEFSGETHEEIARHTAECGSCRAKLRLLQDEQRQFEHDIPFERFAGGVERACRVPRPRPRRRWAMGGALGLVAAAAAVALFVRPSPRVGDLGAQAVARRAAFNQTKGGLSAVVRIASASGGTQRLLPPAGSTALQPGERIRLGYSTATPGYLTAVSVDDAGQVSALYPEGGESLPVNPTPHLTFLPDSLVLTGSGRERVFLFLADRPLDRASVEQSVREAHAQAKGDLGALPTPTFEGRSDVRLFSWLFHKP